jgi:hypothetical protein
MLRCSSLQFYRPILLCRRLSLRSEINTISSLMCTFAIQFCYALLNLLHVLTKTLQLSPLYSYLARHRMSLNWSHIIVLVVYKRSSSTLTHTLHHQIKSTSSSHGKRSFIVYVAEALFITARVTFLWLSIYVHDNPDVPICMWRGQSA